MDSTLARKPRTSQLQRSNTAKTRTQNQEGANAIGARAGMPVFLQRQPVEEEEEMMQPMLQRQPLEEEEEMMQPMLQRQPLEEEEEMMQPMLQRQPLEEEEEMMQPMLQRQPLEEEEMMQPMLQRQPLEEEEEMMQPMLQRQPLEEEEEMMQPMLQRQPLEEEEEMMQPMLQRQPLEEEEEMMQPMLQRQPLEEEEEMQTKLSVGEPDDEYEREADAVADKVMRMPSSQAVGNTTQPVLQRQPVEEEEEMAQPKLRRDSAGSGGGTPGVSSGVENQIQQMRGNGASLPSQVGNDMGGKMGADFSDVNVHTGADASDLNQQVNARAFTLGNDIFFNEGEYAPNSDSGQRLLAHELTHVVQQNGADSINRIRRTDTNSGGLQPPAGVEDLEMPVEGTYGFRKDGKEYKYFAVSNPKTLQLPEIRVPNFKQRHSDDYSQRPLVRPPKPGGRGSTNQRSNWRSHFSSLVATPLNTKRQQAVNRGGFSGDDSSRVYFFKGTRNSRLMLFGTEEQLVEPATFPFWDDRQRTRTFQVDHKREDQLGGEDDSNCTNYELLDAGANGRSGGMIARELNSQISSAVSVFQSPYFRNKIGSGSRRISGRTGYIKQRYQLEFNNVRYNLGGVPNGNRFWSTNHIEGGDHLDLFEPLTAREVERMGASSRTLLFTSPSGGVPIRAPTEGQRVEIWPRVFTTSALQLPADETAAGANATLTVDAYRSNADTSPGVSASYPNMQFYFNRIAGMDAWAIDRSTTLQHAQEGTSGVFTSLRLPGLSPIRIDELDLNPGLGFVGRGKLLPSVPLLSEADIDIVIQGADIRLQKTFDFGEMNIPRPFEIYHSSITAFAGTQGLGLDGLLGFGIERIGEGELQAEISTGQGFALSGQFNFDERIFGEGTQAQVRMGYRKAGEEYQWSMGGTLTIPEGKVPGVRSATINVDYSEGAGFSAEGDAQLDVPGVESGTLAITHSEEEGFVIGGTFNLSADTPGIRGGTISAQVRERPDGSGYAVSASGEAQPDIPGINSNLIVSYNDGAFTAEVSADYARGMLSGRINAGVTNRTVGDDGQLTETAQPDSPLIVYGGGSLTIQIAPWLQGTAGVQFAPDGEITVTGEIGLPDELEIFARREINRSIFNIAVQAPIFPGIVAEVGGGLSATAGIGPGVIDELRLGITYNPAHEEDTTITGDAHLNIPADAGLRLAVRAGIGLGITGASATGGLEIGGTLGIEGAAEAGVHVEWSPAGGLDLRADLAVHAQPAFTFDISGYVSVRALGFSVYDQTWELASFRFGSDYTFGIRMPIHYIEGQPFDISTDDIEFEVPDIDTDQLMRGLISRIA